MATRYSNVTQPRPAPAPESQRAQRGMHAPSHAMPLSPSASGVLHIVPKMSPNGVLSVAPKVGTTGHLRKIPTVDGTSSLPRISTGPLTNPHVSADAPRPIGVDPAETGSFSRLTATDSLMAHQDASVLGGPVARPQHQRPTASGARRSNYRMTGKDRPRVPSRQRRVRVSKGPLVVVSCIAAVIIAIAGFLLFDVFAQPAAASHEVVDAARVEQTQTDPGEGILYDGYNYSAQPQDNGRWALVRTSTNGADPLILFEFEGTPANVVLYDGIFVVPENLDGSWEVVAWMMGDGSVPTKLVGQDGQPITGEGQVSDVQLDGSNLKLTLDSGEERVVDLSM